MAAPKPTVKLKAKLPKEKGTSKKGDDDCNGLPRHLTAALREKPGTLWAIVRLSVPETVKSNADGTRTPVFGIEQIEAVDGPSHVKTLEDMADHYYLQRNAERGQQTKLDLGD